jgi:hypothetical protein
VRKKKCYIYTRVSTAAQTEGYSLEAQQERLREYADYKNLEIAGEYCDAGKSGHSIKGRPEFTTMRQDIAESGEDIDFILVEEMIKRYKKDPAFKNEVLKDGKVTPKEFMTFAKKHNV